MPSWRELPPSCCCWFMIAQISVDAVNVLLIDCFDGFGLVAVGELVAVTFVLFILLELGLHVGDCICIDLTLDGRSRLDNVKVLEEVIEADHTLLEVFDRDRSVIVKIESHPVLVHRDLHMRVSLAHVSAHFVLLGRDHVDVGRDGLRDRVVQEENVLNDGAELVVDVGVKLFAVSPH